MKVKSVRNFGKKFLPFSLPEFLTRYLPWVVETERSSMGRSMSS